MKKIIDIFRPKPNKKFSLKGYVIRRILCMILLMIVALEVSGEIASMMLLKDLYAIYMKENEGVTLEMAKEAVLHNNLSDAMMKEVEMYNYLILPVDIVLIVLLVILFTWIILRRMFKEMKNFEYALDSISDVNKDGLEAKQIDSDIKEFSSICISYNRMVKRLQTSEEMRSELEEQKRRMTADISHDLKTPITVIRGYAKALNDGVANKEEEHKYLDAIYRKTETVAELIDTFHEFSKLDHPSFEFEMSDGDICEYFREYLAMKYEELDLAGFELEADLPDEEIPFRFDKKQLKRVFENLITNSFRHNDKGTVLYADLSKKNGKVVIHVGDNGKGIPREYRETIFEPFVVGSSSRTGSKGSGLGLAISKKIIEAHGGTIQLTDDESGKCKTLYEIVL